MSKYVRPTPITIDPEFRRITLEAADLLITAAAHRGCGRPLRRHAPRARGARYARNEAGAAKRLLWRQSEKGRAKDARYNRSEKARAAKVLHSWRKHGIPHDFTMSEYNRLLLAQGRMCALCGKPQRSGKRFDVDHCHATGVVRGLLHNVCNRKVGMYESGKNLNPNLAAKIAAYLNKETTSEVTVAV